MAPNFFASSLTEKGDNSAWIVYLTDRIRSHHNNSISDFAVKADKFKDRLSITNEVDRILGEVEHGRRDITEVLNEAEHEVIVHWSARN